MSKQFHVTLHKPINEIYCCRFTITIIPNEGYAFNMRKATRSTYHKQIKYIERNEDMIRKDKFYNELLSKDMSQFWRSVTDLRGKVNELVIILMNFLMIMMFLNVLLTRMKMFLIKWVLTVLT